MNNLKIAKEYLGRENATFVLGKEGKVVYASDKKGVAPLMELFARDEELLNKASIADKVVGKAAALLFLKGKVNEVYTEIISSTAKDVLISGNIYLEYMEEVPYISNREGTGRCPLEKAVLDVEEPEEGYITILQTIKELKEKSNGKA